MGTEEWRNVPGYEGYRVSTTGKMERYIGGRMRRIGKPEKQYGRMMVGLYVLGQKRCNWSMARWVLWTFVGTPPEGKPYACHKDGDCTNDNLTNLYWGSPVDNTRDAISHGTTLRKLSDEDVFTIRTRYAAGGVSQQALADEYGVSDGTTNKIVLGLTRKEAGGPVTITNKKGD